MKSARFFLGKKGFTLVELLIVIALLGILAAAVLAAINPIEQANRARDTRLKSDTSQMLAAIDRYFAAQSEMPWATSTDPAPALDWADASAPGVGICDTDTDPTNNSGAVGQTASPCTYDGLLLTNLELKSEFANRDFVDQTTPTLNRVRVGKGSGSSASVYACFVPLSQSERQKLENLRSLPAGGGTPTSGCTTTDWTTSPCYICIPQ